MSSLKYLVSEVVWSGGIFLAAQTLLNNHRNIIGILHESVCVSVILSLPHPLCVATCHFDHEGDTTLQGKKGAITNPSTTSPLWTTNSVIDFNVYLIPTSVRVKIN